MKTDTSDFLVSPYKIVANDSVYFIEDSFQKKIYKYNKFTGTYASIGRPGEGPEENLELDDFSVTNEGIIIHDSKLKKISSI
ncbi:6-bladed beta-propeller [Algoriphagus boritolerans]|uniref:6-bladed beta-propeller n=1 Tax=Algoriphagus boritolerans TaxID=308111 RepID=UPI000A5F0CFA